MGLLLAVIIALASVQTTLGADATTLRAGGSTLIAPLMRKWASEYRKVSGVSVEYAATGSGAGISGMIDESLDFGCTDAPMSDAELEVASRKGGAVAHIPLAIGAVAPIYNVEETKEPLHFTGALLADIFMGRVRRWNDPAIAAINPNVSLPDRQITPVHRLDSSGTTYVWTQFLAKSSSEWQKSYGVGKVVDWPTGVAAKGNDGVAGQVKQIPDSIGYTQLSQALFQVLTIGAVRNADGQFVEARPDSATAAAENSLAAIPDDLRFSIIDSPGRGSYPISTVTWAIAYVNLPAPRQKLVGDFLRWALHGGQQYARPLGYAPLPQTLTSRAESQLVRATAAK